MGTRSVIGLLVLIALGYIAAIGFLAPPPMLQSFSNLPTTSRPSAVSPLQASPTAVRPTDGMLPSVPATTSSDTVIDARLLLIAASKDEETLHAMQRVLDFLGTPYTVWIVSQQPGTLTSARLSSGNHGFYQGVMLTTGGLGAPSDVEASRGSMLSLIEWQVLRSYEAAFHIRQATWFTYPTVDYGFGKATETGSPPSAPALTAAGQQVFAYLKPTFQLTFHGMHSFLALPASDATTPLIVDTSGNALAAIHTYPDGHENLALTFEQSPDLLYSIELSYGIIDWVTRGFFLGERHVYLNPQVDDMFIASDIWMPGRPCSASEVNTGETYRLTGDDLQAVIDWQQAKHQQSETAQLRMELVFNGAGTTGIFSRDTLTPVAKADQGEFAWVNHTLDHLKLNHVTYAQARMEIEQNNLVAAADQLALTTYNPANMVTPEVSGLANPEFLKAAYDTGVRYLVSDTSETGYDNPSLNVGIYNQYQPAILMIPRHGSNLGFNVSTPEQWVAAYNCLNAADLRAQGVQGPIERLNYQQILDSESDQLLSYLLNGDIDPLMFHQANLRAYDGVHTLLGDLIDATMAKYTRDFNLPVLSLPMNEIGRRMANRMQYNDADVSATIVPGRSITLRAEHAAIVPVTGLWTSGAEQYGGQYISHILLAAGQQITLPLCESSACEVETSEP